MGENETNLKVSVEKLIDYLRISAAAFGSHLVGRFLRRPRYGGVKRLGVQPQPLTSSRARRLTKSKPKCLEWMRKISR